MVGAPGEQEPDMGKPAQPKQGREIKLTEKELAVLQAIEELGETALVGQIQVRANAILKRRKQN